MTKIKEVFTGKPAAPKPVLKKGDKGDLVKELQKKLNIEQDGIFGINTKNAVIEFQKKHKLSVDGIVGPYTWSKL